MHAEPDETARLYTARYLVDLCLEGHFCLTEATNAAIWRIWETFGIPGRELLYTLPELSADAPEEAIRNFESAVLRIEQQLAGEAETRRGDRIDKNQMKFWV